MPVAGYCLKFLRSKKYNRKKHTGKNLVENSKKKKKKKKPGGKYFGIIFRPAVRRHTTCNA
jgi:hypothetical protein